MNKEEIEKYEHYCKTTGIEELMKERDRIIEIDEMGDSNVDI